MAEQDRPATIQVDEPQGVLDGLVVEFARAVDGPGVVDQESDLEIPRAFFDALVEVREISDRRSALLPPGSPPVNRTLFTSRCARMYCKPSETSFVTSSFSSMNRRFRKQ